MSITQLPNKKWLLDITLGGRGGKRIRKRFTTKENARRFEAMLLTNNQDALLSINKSDKRRLSDLVKLWNEHHGITLKDIKKRMASLSLLVDNLHNPIAIKFKASDFTEYRAKKLSEGLHPNTLNHHLAYLRAVFNELIRLGYWQHQNPLKVRSLKFDEKELTFLNNEQIRLLLSYLSGDAYKITLLCLATGARWSEAETIRAEQLQPCRVAYSGTKNGKVRVIPITQDLYKQLKTKQSGRLFNSSMSAFRYAVKQSGLQLPSGQLTHVLRHTFASHFMMNGGNILTLQKILGHSTLAMTIKYAHLAPEHLQEATRLNPVVTLSSLA
jgi:integrase